MSEEQSKRVYGIDLGTTFSAIAFVDDYGKAVIIQNDSDQIVPSVVFFESSTNVVVGKSAKASAATDPNRVVELVKREMGKTRVEWFREIDGKRWSAEEVSAQILKSLKEVAQHEDHDVLDVIITCPAYFGDAERKAVRQAGEIAGLNVLRVLDEPIAAAIDYGLSNPDEEKNILVYDLGGGTFDATVVRIGKNRMEVVCTDGDHRLGGADWNACIIDYMITEFQRETGGGNNIRDNIYTMHRIGEQAEEMKIGLTRREKAVARIEHEGECVNVELTRERFNELTSSLLTRTLEFTNNVIEEAKKRGVPQIDQLLLVGGSTRMRQVGDAVREKFGSLMKEPPKSFHEDTAVACGAARFGQILMVSTQIKTLMDRIIEDSGNTCTPINMSEAEKKAIEQVAEKFGLEAGKVRTLNELEKGTRMVASRSYGIRGVKEDGSYAIYNLILRQSPVPVEIAHSFPINKSNAENLQLPVFSSCQSEQLVDVENCEEIGHTEMTLEQGLPQGSLVEITFSLSEEGRLSLRAKDLTHGTIHEEVFEAKGGLTQAEVEEARRENADVVVEI